MRTKRVVYIFTVVALLLMSACASMSTESGTEQVKPKQCLDIKDCPAGYRCDFKTYTCVRSY